jgi:carbohydrate diacid regulator
VDAARRAATLLRERHGVVVHIGIGESGSGVAALAASRTEAKDAVRLAGASTGVEIREITHSRVRQLLDSASTVARTRFNLVTTAQRLDIHRNTVITGSTRYPG